MSFGRLDYRIRQAFKKNQRKDRYLDALNPLILTSFFGISTVLFVKHDRGHQMKIASQSRNRFLDAALVGVLRIHVFSAAIPSDALHVCLDPALRFGQSMAAS